MKLTWYKKLFTGAGTVVLSIYGIVGTIATLLTLSGDIAIPIKVLSICGLFLICLIVFCVASIINCNKLLEEEQQHPVHEFEGDRGKKYLYIAYSRDIHHDALVALYWKTNKKNKRIGFGIVSNVSEYEYIEIEILFADEKYKNVFERAYENDKRVLKDMYVLPRIYRDNIAVLASIVGGMEDATCEDE